MQSKLIMRMFSYKVLCRVSVLKCTLLIERYCSFRVQKLHQRWVSLRSLLHSKLITPLSSLSFPVVEERTVTRQTRTVMETRLVDTNSHFRNLQECIEWCHNKLVCT